MAGQRAAAGEHDGAAGDLRSGSGGGYRRAVQRTDGRVASAASGGGRHAGPADGDLRGAHHPGRLCQIRHLRGGGQGTGYLPAHGGPKDCQVCEGS